MLPAPDAANQSRRPDRYQIWLAPLSIAILSRRLFLYPDTHNVQNASEWLMSAAPTSTNNQPRRDRMPKNDKFMARIKTDDELATSVTSYIRLRDCELELFSGGGDAIIYVKNSFRSSL